MVNLDQKNNNMVNMICTSQLDRQIWKLSTNCLVGWPSLEHNTLTICITNDIVLTCFIFILFLKAFCFF